MAKTLTVARFTAATVFLWRAPSATYGGKNDTCFPAVPSRLALLRPWQLFLLQR